MDILLNILFYNQIAYLYFTTLNDGFFNRYTYHSSAHFNS
jgi:hypothetical protein